MRHMRDQPPCLRAIDGFRPSAGHSAAASEPCEYAFDDPSPGEDLDAFGGIWAFDDLQRPGPQVDEGAPELRSDIAAICEHVASSRHLAAKPGKDAKRAVTILDTGGVDLARARGAAGVGEDLLPLRRKT